ncbi:MAG: polysaccharide deacetylase family protein [Spirochaetota bacterium]
MRKLFILMACAALLFLSCEFPFGPDPSDPDDPNDPDYPDYAVTESEIAYVKGKLALASTNGDSVSFYAAFGEFRPIPSSVKAHVLVLMYHQITDGSKRAAGRAVDYSEDSTAYQRTKSQFEADMAYLRDNGYIVIGFDDFLKIRRGMMTAPGEKMVIISFDDGWKSQYDHAFPVLKQFGYKASFALITSLVGNPSYTRYMDWNHVREMARYRNSKGEILFSFASHSTTHPDSGLVAGHSDIWALKGNVPQQDESAFQAYLKFLKYELLKSASDLYLRVPENRNAEMPLVLTLPKGMGSGHIELAAMAVQQGYDIIRTSDSRDSNDPDDGLGYYGAINVFSQTMYNQYKLPSVAIHNDTAIEDCVPKYFAYFK